jgi:tight adherence protein B
MTQIFYAFMILLFAAVVLCIEGLYQWWNNYHGPAAKRVDARIRALSAGGHVDQERLSILKKRLLSDSPRLQRWLMSLPRVTLIDRWLAQSGSTWSVGQLLGTSLLFAAGTAVAGSLLPVPLIIVGAVALLVGMLPTLYIARLRNKRIKRLEVHCAPGTPLPARWAWSGRRSRSRWGRSSASRLKRSTTAWRWTKR